MPDYGFNYNLGPQTKPTSLADMLNIAGAAQGLQQSMQMNPLQLQEAQQKLRQQQLLTQKAEALTPQEITTGGIKLQEEAKQAPIATAEKTAAYKKQQGALATQIATGFLSDPAIINMAKNPQEAGKVFALLNERYKNNGVDEEAAKAHIDELKNIATNYPDKFADILKYIGTAATTSQEQATRRTPQLTNAGTLFTPASGTISAPNIEQKQTIQPTNRIQPGEPQMSEPTAPQLPKIGGVSIQFKKRVANDPAPFEPNEKENIESGNKYIQDLSSINYSQSKRNLDEVIKEATKLGPGEWWSSGWAGAFKRKASEIVGDPTYKKLSKGLANVQISEMQANGQSLQTDQGKALLRAANGDETYPPDVLISIARRSYANLQDAELKTTAATKFAEQFGQANMASFKQIWNNNSDSKLFESMAIQNSKMSEKKKREEIVRLLGFDASLKNRKNLTEEQLAEANELAKKTINIRKMLNGDFAGVK